MKKVFQQYYREGIFEEIATDVIRPTAEECRQNGHLFSNKQSERTCPLHQDVLGSPHSQLIDLYFTINTADALFADKEKLCIYILQ